MELAYLPDPMTRFNVLNAYPTWEEINLKNKYSATRKTCKEVKTSEKNCSICQQKKKRLLSDYIKSKQMDRQNSSSIQEEDEEAEEEQNDDSSRSSSSSSEPKGTQRGS